MLDPVTGDHRADAVAAALTVQEHRLGTGANDLKNLTDLLPGWAVAAAERDVGIEQAAGLRRGWFARPGIVAQVDDGSDSELMQLANGKRGRLRAAVKVFIHLVKVSDAVRGRVASLGATSGQQEDQK